MSLVDKIIGIESGGNPNARNSRSSAAGPSQFIDSTWLNMLAKNRPDIQGSRDQLLALKTDPQLSRQMTEAYASENGSILAKSGLPVTAGSTYLAHFAGPQGAVSLLSANPNTPAAAIMGEKAVAANPFLRGKTAGDVVSWADKLMGGKGAAPAAPVAPQPMPEAPQQQPAQQPAQQAPQARQLPTYTDAPIQAAQFQPLNTPQMPSLMAAMQPLQTNDINGLLAALQKQTAFG
jgi:hypothetical protein